MPLRVPLLDLRPEYLSLRDEILAVVTRVCDSQHFILGDEVEAFESELAAMLGVRHALAVSSGTDALLLSLMALGIGEGDEVITPVFSFFATAGVVARLGARPVFVDIDADTFNLDATKIRAAVTPRTRAIVPVHLFGLAADLDAVLAAAAGVPVIEDAAQAIGATYRNRPVGGLGDVGCFSFFPTKNLGAFGDAGAVVTNDEALAARARLLRTHGMGPKYCHHLIGGNFRMDALQAAVLRVKARHLAASTDARRSNATRYRELFAASGLSDLPVMPVEPAGRLHTFNQFVIRVADRDGLKAHLDSRGIGSEIYYPLPFHLQPCFEHLGYRRGDFPVSERAAGEVLALPIYGGLSGDQLRVVVDEVAAFVQAAART